MIASFSISFASIAAIIIAIINSVAVGVLIAITIIRFGFEGASSDDKGTKESFGADAYGRCACSH